MSWEKEIQEIGKRRKLAQAQGGAEAVAKHHQRGKLTIRERIDELLDTDSFQEHGKMAGGAVLDDEGEVAEFTPANYVVGLGQIAGRGVAVQASLRKKHVPLQMQPCMSKNRKR